MCRHCIFPCHANLRLFSSSFVVVSCAKFPMPMPIFDVALLSLIPSWRSGLFLFLLLLMLFELHVQCSILILISFKSSPCSVSINSFFFGLPNSQLFSFSFVVLFGTFLGHIFSDLVFRCLWGFSLQAGRDHILLSDFLPMCPQSVPVICYLLFWSTSFLTLFNLLFLFMLSPFFGHLFLWVYLLCPPSQGFQVSNSFYLFFCWWLFVVHVFRSCFW